jgi:peptide/nickel transport system substrate-binding protein
VVEFKPGDVCTYEVNENYREADKPYFAQVEFKGGGDATSAAQAAMRTGEVDWAWNLQVQADVLAEFEESAETGELVVIFGTNLERILIQFADPRTEVDGAFSEPSVPHPWQSDLAVRQAYTYVPDRDSIAGQLYGAAGQASSNILNGPPRFVSPNTSFEFNVETAASMLDEAGWVVEDGQRTKDGVKMQILYQTSTNPVRQKTQEIIKQSMEEIGIPVEIKAIDAGVYFSSDAGNPDTAGHFYADWEMFTNGSSVPYPIAYMANYKSVDPAIDVAQKANSWSGGNYYRWVNDDYNALYTQAESELDEATQDELFIAMNDLLVEQVVEIPLVHRAQVSAKAFTLQGVNRSQWCPETYDVQNWYFEEE